jgi:membrane-associated phospholipid phosphatase
MKAPRPFAPNNLRTLVNSPDALPIALVSAMGLTTVSWNSYAALTWQTPIAVVAVIIIPCAFFLLSAIYSFVLPNRLLAEIALYFALWAVFPIFGIQLSYLAATLDLPLRDKLFTDADAALGFDWRTWASLAWRYPTFIKVLIWSYQSNLYQPLGLVLIFSIFGPRGRNREFLSAMAVASIATVILAGLLPTFGPNEVYGIPSGWHTVLSALRARTHEPLPYVGIVSFPSYHASMAVILTAVTRSYRWAFVASSIVNGLMLIATIPIGYHYLVDLIAGCVIAAGALYIVQRVEKPGQP